MPSVVPFPPTRWSLIDRIRGGAGDGAGDGQIQGLGELVGRYADCLARYLRIRFAHEDRTDLDDVIQEVLVSLLEQPELLSQARPREGGRFRYFIATVALNQARNAFRRRWRERGREVPSLTDQGTEIASETAESTQVDHAWTAAVLAAAWTDLRGWASQGDIESDIPTLLEGHLVQGVTLRELAEQHHLSLATCQRRIAKGRTWLQRAIADHGLES